VSYNTDGYRERWLVPCTDALGSEQHVIVGLTEDRQGLHLLTPTTARLDADGANELVRDLIEAALHLPAERRS
jgi:hypothetical protein